MTVTRARAPRAVTVTRAMAPLVAAALAVALPAAPASADSTVRGGSPAAAPQSALGAPAVAVPQEVLTGPDGDVVLVTGAAAPVAPSAGPGPGADTDAGPAPDRPAEALPAVAALDHARAWAAAAGAGATPTLGVAAVTPLAGGRSAVRVVQTHSGVPVVAGELVVVVDAAGGLLSASGGFTDLVADPAWPVSARAARRAAVAAAARAADVPRRVLRPGSVRRVVFDPSLLAQPGDGGRSAWSVTVTSTARPEAGARVVVAADTGRALLVEPAARGLDRVVCDARNRRQPIDAGVCRAARAARTEGQGPVGPRPTAEVDDAYETLGRTSDFFARLGIDLTSMIGYDIGDGRGRQLRATVRYCPPADVDDCPMLNAFWLDDDTTDPYRGGVMYIGDGLVGSDDVVAHELTHGVTSATSRLAYRGEPGAINESMSDVFGELVDQSRLDRDEDPAEEARWLLGEGLDIGAVRSMSDPTRRFLGQPRQPDRMSSPYWWTSRDDDGGVHVNSGVGNKAAFLIAAGGSVAGRDVRGIGIDRTAALYWDVQNRLSPGSTYAVLGSQLRQACAELAAVGSAGLTADDCAQVDAAVEVTEMTVRRVRAEVESTTVLAGERVRIAAQVTDAVRVGSLRPNRRATLVLLAQAAGQEWAEVRRGTVDGRGVVVFGVRPSVTTVYRVQALAAGPWTVADSAPTTVAVVPPLRADAAARSVAVGEVVRVGGSVGAAADPAAPGLVQLQVRDGGWRTVAEAVPTADGSFALTWTPPGPGRFAVRVVRPADGSFARAASATVDVVVG